MQAAGAALPEFEGKGDHAETAPKRRTRDVLGREAGTDRGEIAFEDLAGSNDLCSVSKSRRRSDSPTAENKNSRRIRIHQPLQRCLRRGLGIQFNPMEHKRGARVRVQLAAFATVEIRVKRETAIVQPLEQDDPS